MSGGSGVATPETDEAPAPPLFVVQAGATPEEIAALTAVLTTARGTGAEDPPPTRRPEWSAPDRAIRTTYRPGPDGWRSSALPR